ncbi:MAG TPA: ABC transporter ATP-binding protein [Bryobacteraceae bacterium]|nr:ABC transporter ATP-binding protein [Bryobacteraceae bacterium]
MLEAVSLTKCYSSLPAVIDASFTIHRGQILGYLGPNGSGKSTTVKMITGLLEPTRGQVLYKGHSIREDLPDYKRRLGYVPEEANLYPYLSGYEYLELIGTLRGIPAGALEPKIRGLLELWSLHEHRHSPISSYSKGMRQRLLISAALLHDPEVIVFDEPLSGLDVMTTLVFRKLVAALAREGKIILYSSHVLEIVEKLCTHVLVLHRGNVVGYETIDGIRRLAARPSLEEVFAELTQQTDTDETARGILEVMKA